MKTFLSQSTQSSDTAAATTTDSEYPRIYREFRWRIPQKFNMGVDVCDRQASLHPDAVALVAEGEDGAVRQYTFLELKRRSNRLANALRGIGIKRGDRVAILRGQSLEVALSHIAIYKLGAIAVPVSVLFGPDALEYRLANCGATALLTDHLNLAKALELRERLPLLQHVIAVDGGGEGGTWDFTHLLERASDEFTPEETDADDPALIIYTSGTTGAPKGALHAHRVLLGHLPGVEHPHDGFPQPGDLFWTPADWAWIGGLLDVLLPAWHHGVPVLAHRFRNFDGAAAGALMARHRVRNVFLPPTALKLMRQTDPSAYAGVRLRSVASGGETLGSELLGWGQEVLGVGINEFYGQTECNLVVGNSGSMMPVRNGSMGRAVPGHEVAIIDEAGNRLPDGETGQIAIRRGDPVMFLNYWNDPDATANKFIGEWLVTGDIGCRDEDGYFAYLGRGDDVITSAGYRIGPGEIEDCLLRHPAVGMAAVIGVPDAIRTEAVKAYIVLKPGFTGDATLAKGIQEHVKTRLAAHEYPRHIEFTSGLPLTTTGKIMRRVLRQQHSAQNPART